MSRVTIKPFPQNPWQSTQPRLSVSLRTAVGNLPRISLLGTGLSTAAATSFTDSRQPLTRGRVQAPQTPVVESRWHNLVAGMQLYGTDTARARMLDGGGVG